MSAAKPDFNINDAISNVMTAAIQAEPSHVIDGYDWYDMVRADLINLADDFGIDFHSLAAIVAIYSGTKGWESNVSAALLTVEEWLRGIPFEDMHCPVRNSLQMRKAIDILNGANPMDTIVAWGTSGTRNWKTKVFYMNIIGRSTRRVTIDVHMWRLITGDWNSNHRPTGREYVAAEHVFKFVANELGLRPMDLQAIVWVSITGKGA
jgi:hypothetical protein